MSYSDWTPPTTGPTKGWVWVYEGNDVWTVEVHDAVYDGSCEHWEYDHCFGHISLTMGDLILGWTADNLSFDEVVTRLRAAAEGFDRGEA